MNPNSANQRWSLWQYRVTDMTQRPMYAMVRENCKRFGRLMFGSASEMRVVHATDGFGVPYWEITVRSEGHPVHDPQYTERMHSQWRKFLTNGFGDASTIHCHARLEAGTREDGTPADQLIILPGLQVDKTL